jgi:hypothetical protein
MKVLTKTGEVVHAIMTTEHPASRYGLPVMVINDHAYGTFDAFGQFRVVAATLDERNALKFAGYRLEFITPPPRE